MARGSPTQATVLEDWLTVLSAGRGLSRQQGRAVADDAVVEHGAAQLILGSGNANAVQLHM